MTASMTSPGLAARGVSVTLGRRQVLHDVDLDVAPGEWVGLIGPNGAGKSTLLHAISGIHRGTGSIAVGDQGPSARDVALVPQSPIVPVGMSVAEYVLVGRTAHLGWLARESCHDRDVVSRVLERLGLQDFADRDVTGLSGGETQRVVVARALAQESPFLLLDEPTSALDLGHQIAVLELVDELRRERGLGVVAAMHELGTAARFADRLVILSEGEVVAEGNAEEVLQPSILEQVYRTPVRVHEIDGELIVVPERTGTRS